ncbi:RNA polymerase sigma factor [Maribacter sp. Asnod1-A12]|uniref:RNA polymerase sigma factor n=1 Tax=Maribacter sp. Asnod1-A12 TaxID=3160576 RepID=UPI00386741E0
MYNVGMRFMGNREDAEDIVQDSFIDAFRKLDSFKYESSFGAWLKRIVINKCINALKANRISSIPINRNELISEDNEGVDDTAVDIERLKLGISRLPIGYKQIINLYLIDGYDHGEIGEILGIATSTSKSQYHRAKKKLILILKEL